MIEADNTATVNLIEKRQNEPAIELLKRALNAQ